MDFSKEKKINREVMNTKKIMTAIVLLFSLLAFQPSINAEIVRIDITAIVDSVTDPGNYLEGKIQKNSLITGYYIYDSSTPDASPSNPIAGHYYYSTPPFGIFLYASDFVFQTNLSNVNFEIGIYNNDMGGGPYGGDYTLDVYHIVSHNNIFLPNNMPIYSINWQIYDSYGNALQNDSLPIVAPNVRDYQVNYLVIEFSKYFRVYSHVISAVPEPSTILLLGLDYLFLRRKKI